MEHPVSIPAEARRFGFWRRLIAAFLDGLVLFAAGLAVTFPFADQLMELGQGARVIGFAVSLLYFGILNSSLGGGATIGKRICGLRVVRRDGKTISLFRALLRTVIYLMPFYLNGIDLTFLHLPAQQMNVALVADTAIIFGGGCAIVYLYLFNARTRQSLHDLVAGTFVVRRDLVDEPIAATIRPLHVVIVSLWFLVFIAGVPLAGKYLGDYQPRWNSIIPNYETLFEVADLARAEPDVRNANATENTTYAYVNGKTQRSTALGITVFVRHRPANPDAVIESVAKRILAKKPDILGCERLTVTVKWGYDIGIGSYWDGKAATHTPAEWRAKWQPPKKQVAPPPKK